MNNQQELKNYLHLNMVSGVGPHRFFSLLSHFGSAEDALNAEVSALCEVEGIERKTAGKIVKSRDEVKVEREIELCDKHGVDIVIYADDRYPHLLKEIHQPPPLLYVKGDLKPDEVCLAVVGTRGNTVYGKTACYNIVSDLASEGIVIVSGLARGIDKIAHRACLDAGGRTYAIMGHGLSRIYPSEHKQLAREVLENGAIISEFPMTAQPKAHHFPRRNRIMSGMSYGVLVVEAPERSGALITATHALNQNRYVFAIPGPINSKVSKGTNDLIKDGAFPVDGANDILLNFGLSGIDLEEEGEDLIREKLTDEQKEVYDILSRDKPLHIDEIIKTVEIPAGRVSAILMDMELSGYIRQESGMLFMRAR